MKNVKVSVLMPIYNTEETLLRGAIEGVLEQTFEDFELLILNDSPENKKLDEIVQSYKDKRIKYFKNEHNMGISKSRNKLLDLAQGQFIAVTDHDDISLPDRFEKQVKFLEENANVGVVGANMHKNSANKISKNPKYNEEIKTQLMHKCAIKHPACMIRKSVLDENNLHYDEKYTPAEDYKLFCDLIEFTDFHNLEDVLLCYKGHPNNASKVFAERMKKITKKIQNEVKNKYPDWYEEFLCTAKYTYKFKLFGFIPFITVRKHKNTMKIKLFDFIPLLNCSKKIKI